MSGLSLVGSGLDRVITCETVEDFFHPPLILQVRVRSENNYCTCHLWSSLYTKTIKEVTLLTHSHGCM